MTFSVTSTEADLTPESWWQPLSSSASHNSLLPVHQGCISGCICDRILEHIKHAECERTRLRCNITPHHVLQFPRCLLLVDGSYVRVWKIVKKKVKETLQKNTGTQLWLGQRPFKTNKNMQNSKQHSCQQGWMRLRWKEIKGDAEIGTESVKRDERRGNKVVSGSWQVMLKD